MKFEAGITEITWPYNPRWTDDIVDASDKEEAEELFGRKGYYRNLVVREVACAQDSL